jgi:hypothetical protein
MSPAILLGWRNAMKSFGTLLAVVLMGLGCSASAAQTAEPTYKADPDTYKLIHEDDNYRVIEANHKKGVRDKEHGHPVPFVVVNLDDCKIRLYGPDGKSVDSVSKAGSVQVLPAISSHSAENIGDADCKQIFVEKK